MWSKKQDKLIRSLHQKKFRSKEGIYLMEGLKLLQEAVKSKIELLNVYLISNLEEEVKSLGLTDYTIIEEEKMKRISTLSTPPGILATLKIPLAERIEANTILYLDGISDPGNMGTIMRTAESFGVNDLVLSENCVDPFSPKVVQASMGSVFRVNLATEDFNSLSERLNNHQFYAADMEGDDLYELNWKTPAVIVMGSESHGVSKEIMARDTQSISIPISSSVESLNVSIATAIILSDFRRKMPL